MPGSASPLAAVLLVILALAPWVCLFFALRAGRRQRLLQDLPTSKTTGVFMGLVELKGTAEAEQPLVSYLAECPCIGYEWQVEEHWSRTVTETYRDEKGNTQTRTREESGWKTVADGRDLLPAFYLQDDCGVLRVRPAGARLVYADTFGETCGRGDPLYYGKGPAGAVSDSDHRRRFVERAIPLHAPIFVAGPARERTDIVAAEIAAAPHTEIFLVSTQPEESVVSGYRWTFWGAGLLGLALLLGLAYVLTGEGSRFPSTPSAPLRPFFAAGGAYLGLWLLGWAVMAYNSLVNLRQRVRQAWANVDVQLKRRSDLIPALVACVTALRGYEQRVQSELAHLRGQLAATRPGLPGPDPAGCAAALQVIVERYPELTADAGFRKLQEDLVDTEQRISLARGYFNDIATFYNTRLEVVPDRFLAALAAMRPQPLLAAAEFARAPVAVSLA
jgi:hypothetical protein